MEGKVGWGEEMELKDEENEQKRESGKSGGEN